jgi:hypothetical protein
MGYRDHGFQLGGVNGRTICAGVRVVRLLHRGVGSVRRQPVGLCRLGAVPNRDKTLDFGKITA